MSRFKVTISTKWFYHLGSPIEIKVKLKNTGKRDYYVLFRNTPFESVHNDCFKITCNKEQVEYDSIYAKRTPVTGKNFVLVKAGKTKKITVSLAERYYFKNGGFVTLDYKPVIFYTAYLDYFMEFTRIEEIKTVRSRFLLLDNREIYPTKGVKMRLEELEERSRVYGDRPPMADMEFPMPCIIFNQTFHPDEKKKDFENTVIDSHYEMIHYMIHSINEFMHGNGDRNTHYGMIFGTYEEKRYRMAQLVFEKVLKAVKGIVVYKRSEDAAADTMTGIRVDDDCYGYVNKNGSRIYLCRPFLEAAMTGTDSQIGALFHELSHVYAGTEDFQMDTAANSEREHCMELAKNNPDLAVRNAAGYEFFLESRFLSWTDKTKWPGTKDVDTKILGGPSIVCRNHMIYLFYLSKDGLLYG